MEIIKEKVEVNKYKSLDGKVFDSLSDCREHDRQFISEGNGNRRLCPECNGTGKVHIEGHYVKCAPFYLNYLEEDFDCWEEGHDEICYVCGGKGYQELKWC